jgi:hypothetical protein
VVEECNYSHKVLKFRKYTIFLRFVVVVVVVVVVEYRTT